VGPHFHGGQKPSEGFGLGKTEISGGPQRKGASGGGGNFGWGGFLLIVKFPKRFP